ncbi:MAG: hypothetical protein H6711_28735 [Myxococcales bacterium]|nr:hypothetical protein [Myxococcales bacterium]
MKRLAAGLLALVACAPKVLPDDLRSILLGVAPISDEIVLVCSADHVTSVSAEGAILARTELRASCYLNPDHWQTSLVTREEIVIAQGMIERPGEPLPLAGFHRQSGALLWRRDVPLSRIDAPAEAPFTDVEHCLIVDPKVPREGAGVVIDLDCDRGDELWRRVFPDVQTVYRGGKGAAVIGAVERPPPHGWPGWRANVDRREALGVAYEVRFVDLVDGAVVRRAPIDPVAHCQLDDEIIAVEGDDLVAYRLSQAPPRRELLVPGFAAHLEDIDLHSFACHSTAGGLVLALSDVQKFGIHTWLVAIDARAMDVRWTRITNGPLALGIAGPAGLSRAGLVTTRDGYGALDLSDGRRLGHLDLVPAEEDEEDEEDEETPTGTIATTRSSTTSGSRWRSGAAPCGSTTPRAARSCGPSTQSRTSHLSASPTRRSGWTTRGPGRPGCGSIAGRSRPAAPRRARSSRSSRTFPGPRAPGRALRRRRSGGRLRRPSDRRPRSPTRSSGRSASATTRAPR